LAIRKADYEGSATVGNDGDGVTTCLLIGRQWVVCHSQRCRELHSKKNETASVFSRAWEALGFQSNNSISSSWTPYNCY
jgi:hypothetical protein